MCAGSVARDASASVSSTAAAHARHASGDRAGSGRRASHRPRGRAAGRFRREIFVARSRPRGRTTATRRRRASFVARAVGVARRIDQTSATARLRTSASRRPAPRRAVAPGRRDRLRRRAGAARRARRRRLPAGTDVRPPRSSRARSGRSCRQGHLGDAGLHPGPGRGHAAAAPRGRGGPFTGAIEVQLMAADVGELPGMRKMAALDRGGTPW